MGWMLTYVAEGTIIIKERVLMGEMLICGVEETEHH